MSAPPAPSVAQMRECFNQLALGGHGLSGDERNAFGLVSYYAKGSTLEKLWEMMVAANAKRN